MSKLERKFPFVVIVAALTAFTVHAVMGAAGMPPMASHNLAQAFLHFCCLFAVWRTYSFLGWLLVLWISPAAAGAVDRTASRP